MYFKNRGFLLKGGMCGCQKASGKLVLIHILRKITVPHVESIIYMVESILFWRRIIDDLGM